jgi:pimeloyl-[acyl-carrier protein] synthase
VSSNSIEERFFIDAMSPAFREDPYPYYDTYRGAERLVRADETIWLSFAHADVWTMLRHPRLSSNEARATTEIGLRAGERARQRSLLFMDPPDHTRLRGLVSKAFTPRRIEGLRATVESICAGLLDNIVARHRGGQAFDLIEALAYPLPVRVICALLGVPATDERVFTRWSRALAKSLDPSVLRSADAELAIEEAEIGLRGYLSDLLDARRQAPGNDLLSDLLAVQEGGDRISAEEVVELAKLLLVAGHETTVNLIGNGVLALLRAPGQLDLLAQRPELIADAVDELLRFDSPVQINQRIATVDLELAGARVRAGDEIVLVLGAANRDPAVFPEPGRLDVTRDSHRHVAFGGGIHHCLGASLARLEGQVALSALLARLGRLELAGPPVRRPIFVLRGLESLPVAIARPVPDPAG